VCNLQLRVVARDADPWKMRAIYTLPFNNVTASPQYCGRYVNGKISLKTWAKNAVSLKIMVFIINESRYFCPEVQIGQKLQIILHCSI